MTVYRLQWKLLEKYQLNGVAPILQGTGAETPAARCCWKEGPQCSVLIGLFYMSTWPSFYLEMPSPWHPNR